MHAEWKTYTVERVVEQPKSIVIGCPCGGTCIVFRNVSSMCPTCGEVYRLRALEPVVERLVKEES